MKNIEMVLLIIIAFSQGEIQQLRDKLSVAERAAKADAQLKVYCFSYSLCSDLV